MITQISVIVPVFKVEPYLERCVNSILAQTFKDFEIILIDDGSPDRCGEICDLFSAQDLRVKVIHKENGGLSSARNAGIDYVFANSDSSWITFIDSDDWVHPEYLSSLLQAATESQSDVAIAECIKTKGEGFQNEPDLQYTIKNTADYYVENGSAGTVAWGKLYKKECFNNLRYPVGKLHEDEYVTYKILFQYKQLPVVNSPLYAYFQNEKGIILRPWTPKRLDALEAIEQQVDFFLKQDLEKIAKLRFDALVSLYLDGKTRIQQCEELSKNEKKRYAKRIKKSLRKLLRRYKKQKWVSLWNRGWDLYIYENAYTSLHIALIVWRMIKKIVKAIPGSKRLIRAINPSKTTKKKQEFFRKYKQQQKTSQAVLLQTPLHENIGDHAIALAEKQILQRVGLTCLDFPYSVGIETKCAKATPRGKTVFIHGGGFLGSLWPESEMIFREELKAFSRNPIIVFPQTVYFDMESEEGQIFFAESKEIYEAHPNLTVFLRERNSYEFMKLNMPTVRTVLVPDVVMLLDIDIKEQPRKGVLLCLRNDKEKTLDPEVCEQLVCFLKAGHVEYKYTDTVLKECVDLGRRELVVHDKLVEFASAKMVITDRLHGMIFAAITCTPCIVLNSLSHKVRGCYEWIQELDYIRLAENIEDIPALMDELDAVTPKYSMENIDKAMQPLFDAIRESTR